MYGEVGPPWWDDKPVVLVGGGPSLIDFDFSSLKKFNCRVVGVNQSIFDAPCHAGVSADIMLIHRRRGALEAAAKLFPVFLCLKESIEPTASIHLNKISKSGLSDHPGAINTIGSSGYAALNIAYLKRAKRIVLLGYDYAVSPKHHYHDKYSWYQPQLRKAEWWASWAHGYRTTIPQLRAAGVEVINASPKSAIMAFPKIPLIEAMKGL